MDLGSVGVWSRQLRSGHLHEIGEAAAELEDLGYGAIWIPGGEPEGLEAVLARLLEATQRIVVATGIVSIWGHDASRIAAEHARLSKAHPGRLLLGLGVSHHPLVERSGQHYRRPLQKMKSFLDELDAADPPVPRSERVLAALGPKMLELARDRAAGAHPYFVTPEHTRQARAILGTGPLLAPEQMVLLESEPGRARAIARKAMELYLRLPNYTNNLLRTGFTESDLANGGSDRLVDAIVTWGAPQTIQGRVREHLQAGANHVCIQVIAEDNQIIPRAQWRQLAGALLH